MDLNTNKANKIVTIFFTGGLLTIGSMIMLIPFIWMLSVSFDAKTVTTIPFPPRIIPEEFSLNNMISAILNIKIWNLYLNSFTVAAGVILISVISALMSGYAMSKIKFSGWKIVLFICLATIMIPQESTIIPVFMLFKKIGLLNSYMAFYLPAASYAFGTFLAKQYFDGLPDSLREAAFIDGAGEFSIFVRVFLPLAGTITASLVILQFLANWNNLLMPLILLTKESKYTMQIGLALFRNGMSNTGDSQGASYPGVIMAGSVLSVFPVLVVYLFLQRFIVQSIALSGIKQ